MKGGKQYTVKEAAAKLGCNPETIRRAIRSKELLATKAPLSLGPAYVITAADLASFVEKRRVG